MITYLILNLFLNIFKEKFQRLKEKIRMVYTQNIPFKVGKENTYKEKFILQICILIIFYIW